MKVQEPIVVITCRECGDWQGAGPVNVCSSCRSFNLRRDSTFKWKPWNFSGERMEGFTVTLRPLKVRVPEKGGYTQVLCTPMGGDGSRWFNLSGLISEAEPKKS